MSRTQSQGLDYVPLDVDFFSDKKIRILKSRYGADGVAIYLFILCQIYREGYYTRVDEDFIFVISDELHVSSDTVQQVLAFLLKRSMFDEQLFKSDAVLTSDGIQERWQKAIATRAAKTHIEVCDYWILKKSDTKPFVHCALFHDSSEKNEDNSEKKGDNSENYSQSKVKEKESKVSIVESVCAGAHARENTHAPTMEEVSEYCAGKGYRFAEKFFKYYQSEGWKISDWKAKADYWAQKDIEAKKEQNKAKTVKTRYGTFDPEYAFQKALERTYQESSDSDPVKKDRKI